MGPVALDDAIFYAVERDLLRLQPSTGVVQERLRFADIIRQLDEVDGSLEAVLGRAASSPIAIPTDAPPTPQQALAITNLVGLPATARDANWLAAAAQNSAPCGATSSSSPWSSMNWVFPPRPSLALHHR